MCAKLLFYTLSRQYRVVINQYSGLMFTSEDRLCANLRLQENSTMLDPRVRLASQIKCPWRNERLMVVFSGTVYSGHKIACKKLNGTFVIVNNDFWSLVIWFTNDFHSWLRHSWKILANHFTRDQTIVIHSNSCIILYIIEPCKGMNSSYW